MELINRNTSRQARPLHTEQQLQYYPQYLCWALISLLGSAFRKALVVVVMEAGIKGSI